MMSHHSLHILLTVIAVAIALICLAIGLTLRTEVAECSEMFTSRLHGVATQLGRIENALDRKVK